MLISGKICRLAIYIHIAVIHSGRKNSPLHSEKNRWWQSCLDDIFHVTSLFQCSTRVSQPHSQARDTHTYTLTISRDGKMSKIRARHRGRGLSRPHSHDVPQTMYCYWSQTERESWSSIFMSLHLAPPFRRMKLHITGPYPSACMDLCR